MATDFRKQIAIVVDAIEEEVGRERDAIAMAIVDKLVTRPPKGTPVDTGWCRNNWLPALSQPARSLSQRGARAPTTGDVSRALSTQQAASAQFLINGPKRPRDVAYVSNGTDYVNALAEGHSKQQPTAGWVDKCVAEAVEERGQAQSFSPIRRV